MLLTSPIGIFTTDAKLNITSWNDWLEHATGLSEDSVVGVPVTRIIPEIEKKGLYDRFLNVLTEGNVELLSSVFHHYLIRIPLNPPIGKYSEMQQKITIAPLTGDDKILGTLVAVEDVTVQMINTPHPTPEAIRNLSHEDWTVRKGTAISLASAGKTIISEVLRKVRYEHNNLSILSSAMKVLSLSNEDISDFLIEFLSDEDTELRIYSAQMLSERNSPAVIEALIRALDDEDINVRYHAIESLGKLRALQAVDRLAEIALSNDFFIAFPAVDALKSIGDSRAVKPLYSLIDDEILGQAAIEAIGEMADGDAVPYLSDQINKNSIFIYFVVESLVRISERYIATFGDERYIADLTVRHINEEGKRNLLFFLENEVKENPRPSIIVAGWVDDHDFHQAITRFLGDTGARMTAIDALVKSGQQVTDILIPLLRSEKEIKESVIIALGRIGGEKASNALIPMLDDDEVAVVCCGALSKTGNIGAFENLIGLLGNENPSIRRAAVAALNSIGHPEMPHRIESLLSDPNPYVRESSIKIAGYFGFQSSRKSIHELCLDQDINVRIAAIENLPFIGDQHVLSTLKNFYSDENPKIRAAVVRSLSQVESGQILPLLSLALKDTDPWVRYYAIRSIDLHGLTEVFHLIRQAALYDATPFVRIAAIEYLGHTDGPLSASIIASLTGDPETDVAIAAINALGDIHHPDSLPPLMALTRTDDKAKKKCAVLALGRRGGSGTAGALQWLALTEKETAIKDAAINSLRMTGTKESVRALLNLTSDTSLREKAICALASLPTELFNSITEGLNHRHTLVRTAVIETLLRIHSVEASAMLGKNLDNEDVNIRLSAIYALHRLGNELYMQKIEEMKASDPDPLIRKAIEEITGVPESKS
jgi:PAS domain S-box-containing protein